MYESCLRWHELDQIRFGDIITTASYLRVFIQSAKTDAYRHGQWVTIAVNNSPTVASTLLMQVLEALALLWRRNPANPESPCGRHPEHTPVSGPPHRHPPLGQHAHLLRDRSPLGPARFFVHAVVPLQLTHAEKLGTPRRPPGGRYWYSPPTSGHQLRLGPPRNSRQATQGTWSMEKRPRRGQIY